MRHKPAWVFAAVLPAVACGYETHLAYKEPPVGSYTTGVQQVKIGDAATSVQGATVTLEFFRAAGVQPLLGRLFIDGDQASSAQRVVVLSHDLWAERFASSPSIIGQRIEIAGRQTTVVGIAPRGFKFPEGRLLWTPKDGGAF